MSFVKIYKDDRLIRSTALELDTHKTAVLKIKVSEVLSLSVNQIACGKRPVRLRLIDGQVLDLKCRQLVAIIDELRSLKIDLDNGHELLLPDVRVWHGNSGRSIEGMEGSIPEDARIEFNSDLGERQPVLSEDERAWRAGRNPQHELIAQARSRKPRRRRWLSFFA